MAKLQKTLQRLEALSLRERAMLLLGVPLVLVAAAETLAFEPARKKVVELAKTAARQQTELKAINDVLALQPSLTSLPAADQLQRQRDELRAEIDRSRALLEGVRETVDWGTVVRSASAGNPGLVLTSLKTLPPETVFTPDKLMPAPAKPGAPAPAAAAASAAKAAPVIPDWAKVSIYRHRAELTVQGDLAALQTYLQALQKLPGDLHWERLHLNAAKYPQGQAQLTIYTLSSRGRTPFN